MVKLRSVLVLCLATALTGSVTAASAAKGSDSRPPAKGSSVTDHIAEVDGPMMTLAAPDHRTWAVWSYRSFIWMLRLRTLGDGNQIWIADGPDPIAGIKGPNVPAGGPQTEKTNLPTP
jgi:hypothetical protein